MTEHQSLAYWCPYCRKVRHPPMPEAVVIATCAQQWRAVFQFLLESVQPHPRGTSLPPLFESWKGRSRGYLVFPVTFEIRCAPAASRTPAFVKRVKDSRRLKARMLFLQRNVNERMARAEWVSQLWLWTCRSRSA